MGGCRCTYRNCTVKSDGKTHMFHYPVFEKVRCHQWLVNAQKLDFLNLKVSQLKNRVVCQNHFIDDNFMNYKQDKLTFEAIPTEDGPFCDKTKFADHTPNTAYPSLILLEDIENDVVINDKKANYSLKYGDFLTNGELMETQTYSTKHINFTKDNTIKNTSPNTKFNYDNQVGTLLKPRFNKMVYSNNIKSQPVLIVPPYTELTKELKADNQINQELDVVNVAQTNQTLNNNTLNMQSNIQPFADSQIVKKKGPNIKILSEKKIQLQRPLPIRGELKKVSPSTTLNFVEKFNNNLKNNVSVYMTQIGEMTNRPSKSLNVLEVLNVEFDNKLKENEVQNNQIIPHEHKVEKSVVTRISPRTLKLKNKITPERSAAIEQKRKFNMKMKDILESCLDKLDEQQEKKITLPVNSSVKENDIKIKSSIKHNPLEPSLPKAQEYTLLAFLDAKMKKMEKTLLNKIEQNSHNIMELKDSFENVNKKTKPNKKIVKSQTSTDEDCHKKYLFEEISKYLSDSLSSTIYDEMFNKQSLGNQISPPRRKRRKYI